MRKIMIGILLGTASFSMAAGRACPSTFNFYDLGETAAQIKTACGTPLKIEKSNAAGSIQENVTTLFYKFVHNDPNYPPAPPVLFQLKGNKVSSIKIENNEVPSTQACGTQININDTYDQVLAVCGAPVYQDQTTQATPAKAQEVEIWTYHKNEFLKPVKMKFINGTLENVDE